MSKEEVKKLAVKADLEENILLIMHIYLKLTGGYMLT